MKNSKNHKTAIPTIPNASTTLSAVQQAWDENFIGQEPTGLDQLPMDKVHDDLYDSIGISQIKKCIDRLQIKVEDVVTHPVRPKNLVITVILGEPVRPILEEALEDANWHIKEIQENILFSITFSTEK